MDINTESEAYHTGWQARIQGETIAENPYPLESWDADNWSAGWFAADDAA